MAENPLHFTGQTKLNVHVIFYELLIFYFFIPVARVQKGRKDFPIIGHCQNAKF